MTTSEYIKLKVDEKVHNYAKIYSSLLNNEFQRKRSFASLVALYSFVDLLEQSPYTVQKAMTLFKNPLLNEEYEISDLYVNGWHLDVRVVTGGNAVLLPKIHVDNDIVPDFYIVVKVDSTLQNTELVGIVDTKNITKEDFDSKYEAVPFTSLINYDSFLKKIESEKTFEHSEDEHELFRSSYLALLDNNLDTETKNKVIKHLFKCSLCRTEFCCFTGFEMVCCNTTKYPDVLEDHTLGFVGAQNAENEKYQGKEETIYIGTDKNIPEEKSDILDELFDIDEGVVQENQDEEQTNNQIVSIDDILDEVAIDTSIVSVEETPAVITTKNNTEADKDLHGIDDAVFLDVPSTAQKITTTENDLQIIQDEEVDPYSKDENIEFISEEEETKIIEDEEILVIDDNTEEEIINIEETKDETPLIEETEELSEIIQVEDEIKEVYPSDEDFIINDDEEELEIIEDEIIDEATILSQEEPVQKVIVDYDENGEPIYSYINDLEQEKDSSLDTDILLENEEDDFIEYTDDEATVSEIEEISDKQNEDEEEYESVYADENNNDDNSDEDEYIEEDYPDDDEEEYNQEDNNEEEIDYKEEPLEYYEENKEEEQQPSIIDDVLYRNEDEDKDDNEENIVQNIEYEEDEGNEASEEDINREEQDESEEEDENMIDYEDKDLNTDEDGEYDDYDVEDHLPEEQIKKSSNLLAVIVGIIVLLGLIGGAFLFLSKSKETQEEQVVDTFNENVIETTENQAVNDMFEEPIEQEQQAEQPVVKEENNEQQELANNETNTTVEEQIPPPPVENVSMPKLTESDLIKPVERKSNGDINRTIVNAFAINTSPVSLRALNWFCASELFSDVNFKNYLQTIDNSLKQNLKNNFMNLVESAPKDSVAAKFAVDNRGNLKKVIISESSGSEEIDNVVLQSINETFEREKSQILNDNELKQDMYYLKVVIKL